MKRLIDIVASICGLFLASPFLILAALLLGIFQGWPIFFRQERPEYQGRPFTIYKFRTMADKQNGQGELLPDAERMTWIGSLVRKTSLDELPQLWNVLKGEMSLIGPRPLLMEYLPLYSSEQMRRHDVFPGITGWAQVNGRNTLSWEERFKLDVWYVDHQSFLLDLKILWLTIKKVLSAADFSQQGQSTVEKFGGTRGPDA